MRCRDLIIALLLASPALADTTGQLIVVNPSGGGVGDVEAVWGCASGDCSTLTAAAGDSIDAGSADSSRPATRSSSLPGTCTEGQLHHDTDSGGSELYACTATDTWTKLGADGAAPASHAASHQDAGSDELSVAGLSGLLADPQTPAAHALVGATHTASGLTTGHVVRATGATTFAFGAIEEGDLPATIARDSELHAQQHALDGADHTLSGATDGQSLQATGATTFALRWARTRRHATDCTGLTDGAAGETCYEEDADRWFVCEPTAGACDTAAEWRPLTIDGSQVTTGTVASARLPAATEAAQGAVELATSAETAAGLAVQASDTRLSDARTPTAHVHAAADVTTGQLAAARGGTALDTSASTGVAQVAAGTWSVADVALGAQTSGGYAASTTEGGGATSLEANAVDAIAEIAAALKSGTDATLVTGTAGASGNCVEWNADGDIVDAGAACGGGGGAATGVDIDGDATLEITGTSGTDITLNPMDDGTPEWAISSFEIKHLNNNGAPEIDTTGTISSLTLRVNNTAEVTITNAATEFSGFIDEDNGSPTCANNGTGAAGALTLTMTRSYMELTNADPHGCDVTISETSMVEGYRVEVVIVSNAGGTVNFADTAGVSELAGAFAAAINDSITLRYTGTTWVESSRSDN